MADPNNALVTRTRKLGLPLVEHTRIPNSMRAHEGAEYARAHGKLEAFHRAVLEAYWARGEDLSDWAVLRAAALSAGLDAKELEAEVSAGRWRAVTEDALREAREAGVTAVPTFLVGDRFVIQGAQEAGVFRHAFERVLRGP